LDFFLIGKGLWGSFDAYIYRGEFMKTMLLALLVSSPLMAFAQSELSEVQAEAVRYNCFYQDGAMGYKYGAIANTLEVSKARAYRECHDFLVRSDLQVYQCKFVGCREY
jgi:hypothetical protein